MLWQCNINPLTPTVAML